MLVSGCYGFTVCLPFVNFLGVLHCEFWVLCGRPSVFGVYGVVLVVVYCCLAVYDFGIVVLICGLDFVYL